MFLLTKYLKITLCTAFTLCLTLLCEHAFAAACAPVANKNCADAVTLTVDAACTNGATCDDVGLEGGESYCGSIAPDQSVWYKFQATSTNHVVTVENLKTGGCHIGSAVWSGSCVPSTRLTCEDIANGPVIQVHSLSGLTTGNIYYIQIVYDAGGSCGTEQTFCVKVETGYFTNNGGCTCATNYAEYSMGSCHSGTLNGAANCLTNGCAGANPDAGFEVRPQNTTLWVTVDNLGSGFTGNVEVKIFSGECGARVAVTSYCGTITCPADVIEFSQAVTAGTQYVIYVSSSDGVNGANSDFGICIGDGAACAVTGCGVIPGGITNTYAVYAPDGVTGVSDCQLYASSLCGTACLVCTPESGTSVAISTYPIITAENIQCLNTDIDFTTTDPSPVWPAGALGTNATIADPPDVATVDNNQYTATLSRRTINFNGDRSMPSQTFSASPNLAIPDNGCATPNCATSTIAVSGYLGNVATANITVTVNITHTYDADIDMFLTASDGSILELSTDNGGSGDNYTNTVFSDAGATNITTGTAPFTGTYKPEGTLTAACSSTPTVATFNAIGAGSLNPNGNWTLKVCDDVGADVGTLLSWSITFPAYTAPDQNVNYTDFVNMMMAAPSSGTLLGVATGCNGTYSYNSSVAGTPGFTYLWTVTNPGGCGTCSNSIATNTASSTDITFTNTDPTNPQTFIVNLAVTSGCCGLLTPVPTPISVVVNPTPANPAATASPASVCIGGSSTLDVTGPIAGYNYGWYSASTGGTLYGTGTSYTVNPVLSGVTTYYIEAVNSYGCAAAARIAVTVTGTDTPPTVPDQSTCGAGDVTLSVTGPGAGYTYNWYSGSCGGTLLQSGVSPSYTTYITATTTFYVSAVPPGCAASTCVAPVATYNSPPASIVWLGSVAGANNWFNTANWTSSCLPTCASNVSIPDLDIDPDIGFNAAGAAACKDLVLENVAILSFSDSKAELEICGNFTHSGTLTTNNLGKITFKGSTAQTYTKTGSGDFYVLGINNSSATGVTLAQNTNVSESLILTDGQLLLNSNTLTILNPSATSISGGSSASYIVSETNLSTNPSILQWNIGATTGAHIFPFGTATGDYIPVTFDNSGDVGNVSISTRVSGIDNTPLTTGVANMNTSGASSDASNMVVDRWWDISSSIASPTPAVTLSLTYTGSENTMTTPTNEIGIQHWNGTVWDDGNNGGSGTVVATGTAGSNAAGPHTVTGSSAFTYFSPYILVGKISPLPIELLSFEAICNNNSVNLLWSTASEKNNDYFTIERSSDGITFQTVLTVKGAGNSNQVINYSAVDVQPLGGIAYYRLKQTDYDGKFEYSQIIVTCNGSLGNTNGNINVYPNPASSGESVFLNMDGFKDKEILLVVINTLGEQLYSKVILTDVSGFTFEAIDPYSRLAPGVYYIVGSSNNNLFNKKVVIK